MMWKPNVKSRSNNQHQIIHNRPNSQIPQCTCPISNNALFRTEMGTFLFWMVHCGIWDRCTLGFVRFISWLTHDIPNKNKNVVKSISYSRIILTQIRLCINQNTPVIHKTTLCLLLPYNITTFVTKISPGFRRICSYFAMIWLLRSLSTGGVGFSGFTKSSSSKMSRSFSSCASYKQWKIYKQC